MAIAKALGGGFPVAACLATERAAACMGPGSHGSTFGGNPLAMAVANAVLDVMLADGFMAHVQDMADLLMGHLGGLAAAYPGVVDEARGMGLMIGLKLRVDNLEMVGRLGGNGLLTVPAADNVVRLLPPLIVEPGHIDEAVGILEKSFAEVAG
jgi:acetylornithine/N-succinyldiaminopimelate aminotransferase